MIKKNFRNAIIVVIMFTPPPFSLATFLPNWSAKRTVRTVSSWNLGLCGNTEVWESLIGCTTSCACAVSISSSLSPVLQWPVRNIHCLLVHVIEYKPWANKWVKIFKNGPSKICGRQPLKNLKWYGLLRQTKSLQMF